MLDYTEDSHCEKAWEQQVQLKQVKWIEQKCVTLRYAV